MCLYIERQSLSTLQTWHSYCPGSYSFYQCSSNHAVIFCYIVLEFLSVWYCVQLSQQWCTISTVSSASGMQWVVIQPSTSKRKTTNMIHEICNNYTLLIVHLLSYLLVLSGNTCVQVVHTFSLMQEHTSELDVCCFS